MGFDVSQLAIGKRVQYLDTSTLSLCLDLENGDRGTIAALYNGVVLIDWDDQRHTRRWVRVIDWFMNRNRALELVEEIPNEWLLKYEVE